MLSTKRPGALCPFLLSNVQRRPRLLSMTPVPATDFSTFSRPVVLDDGMPVTLRAVRREDGPKIRRAFHTLAAETVHARFFEYRAEVTDAELAQITGVDFRRDAALLATLGAGDAEIVIGGVSYFALDGGDPPLSAELAFTILEGYQGRGIGGLLMRHIVEIARAAGLTYFEADLLAENMAMLNVFRRSGLPMILRREPPTMHVRLELQATYTLPPAESGL
jgi:GNAT superfamily N-acetyltransferase